MSPSFFRCTPLSTLNSHGNHWKLVIYSDTVPNLVDFFSFLFFFPLFFFFFKLWLWLTIFQSGLQWNRCYPKINETSLSQRVRCRPQPTDPRGFKDVFGWQTSKTTYTTSSLLKGCGQLAAKLRSPSWRWLGTAHLASPLPSDCSEGLPGARGPPVHKCKPVTNSSHVKKPGCEEKQIMSRIFYRCSLSRNKRSSKGWVLQKKDTVQFSGQRQPRQPKVCDCC